MLKNAKSAAVLEVSLVVGAVIPLQVWRKLAANWVYRFGNISMIEFIIPALSLTYQIWFDSILWTQD